MLSNDTLDLSVDCLKEARLEAGDYDALCQFIYGEARLLDARKFEDWLGLWAEDGMYWVPSDPDQVEPYEHISYFWEDRHLRDVRVRRLLDPTAWSQQPSTYTARLVGGVSVDGVDHDGHLVASAAFQITEFHRDETRHLAGRYTFKLRQKDGAWKIALKRVDLANAGGLQENFEVFL